MKYTTQTNCKHRLHAIAWLGGSIRANLSGGHVPYRTIKLVKIVSETFRNVFPLSQKVSKATICLLLCIIYN